MKFYQEYLKKNGGVGMISSSEARNVIKNKHEFKGRKLYYDHRLFLLLKLPRNSVGAEIGVYIGDYAKRIIKMTQPLELTLIDPWQDKHMYLSFLQTFIHEISKSDTKVKVIRKTVEDAYIENKIKNDYFDWVYLDTDHELESTRRQLKLCQKIVKPGGLICGDDYDKDNWPHVITAVDEFVKDNGMIVKTKNRQFWIKNE